MMEAGCTFRAPASAIAHAVERMGLRKISTAEVEQLIMTPDGEIKQSRDKFIYFKRFSKRSDNLLAVVALMRPFGEFEVLTVMNHFEVRR